LKVAVQGKWVDLPFQPVEGELRGFTSPVDPEFNVRTISEQVMRRLFWLIQLSSYLLKAKQEMYYN
jgi:hypothetical protein